MDAIIHRIKSSRKYEHIDIPDETIKDLLQQEFPRYKKESDAVRSAKAKLHNIIALYLGDADYKKTTSKIESVFSEMTAEGINRMCVEILSQHHSTRERLPYVEEFFEKIFSICGNPGSLMDLACGLNPFALPFMDLPKRCSYHAYDIHRPRITLINRFFTLSGREPLAEVRDVLIHPPRIQADAAFIFKEAHRMEKRRAGASRELVRALNARFIFLSLPNRSLDGRRDLSGRMRSLAEDILEGIDSVIQEAGFPGETLYWTEKRYVN